MEQGNSIKKKKEADAVNNEKYPKGIICKTRSKINLFTCITEYTHTKAFLLNP